MLPREHLPRPLRPFIDEVGRISQWPTRQKTQRMAAALLARRFVPGRDYTEKEVNALLMDGHTFADWALLRSPGRGSSLAMRSAAPSRTQ